MSTDRQIRARITDREWEAIRVLSIQAGVSPAVLIGDALRDSLTTGPALRAANAPTTTHTNTGGSK